MSSSGIYNIQSIIHPDRCYIGSTVNFKKRWNKHSQDLKNKKHHSKKLQDHVKKYGIDDLNYLVVEHCPAEFLIAREQYYIDTINPWFNICEKAGSLLGNKHSMETRAKMSKSHRGLNVWLKGKKLSKEHRDKLSLALIGNKRTLGLIHKPETIKKMSEYRIGERNPFYGKSHTKETLEKMSEANKGNKYRLGKNHTEEGRRKISEGNKKARQLKISGYGV